MLEGRLVRLRAVEPTDLEQAYAWVNDSEVTRHIDLRYPLSRVDEERWLKEGPANDFANGVRLAIETKPDGSGGGGEHIGNIDLRDVKPEDRKAGLGIMIGDRAYWSNGYGSDATMTLLRFAFHEMNLNRVWLHVFDFNQRAIACYRKCGFQEEGRLRQHAYRGGRYWDVVAMGVLREEFDALHGAAPVATSEASP